MKRNQYIITKPNGDKIAAYGNGYDISASGALSIGQIADNNGKSYAALVLSMQPAEWTTIHQVEGERPKYLESGVIEKVGLVMQ